MPRLLIIDDDPVDRELAARCVEVIDGLEVVEAEDGRQALEMMAGDTPDLVLTDLRMPHLDGLALVQEAGRLFPLVPVILMTARGSEQVAADALAAGAASYVPKADMVGLLAETVEQVLSVATTRHERVEILRYLEGSQLRFRLANDPSLISPLVGYLQDALARACFGDDQVRSQIGTALLEAISNAMIHGNLEVSSELRRNGTKPYHELIRERRQAEPWSTRRVVCQAEQRPGEVRYLIRDEGSGFDRSSLPDPTRPESMLKAQGRGLFLINAFMDEVEHNDAGNELLMVKRA